MEDVYLWIAAGLVLVLGWGCGFGAYALWNGAPQNWPDVIAADFVVRRTARVLAFTSILLLASGAACVIKVPWACEASAVATLLFVAGGFAGNYAVFGSLRPAHTVPNVIIAAVILWLLWLGYPR